MNKVHDNDDCKCTIFPENMRINVDGLNEPGKTRVTYHSFTRRYIEADFGSVEKFYELPVSAQLVIFQLYTERDIEWKVRQGDNWSRKCYGSESFNIIYDITKINNVYYSSKSQFNFRKRCNELNVKDINYDEIIRYLKDKNLYDSNEDEYDDSNSFTLKDLPNMKTDENGYLIF